MSEDDDEYLEDDDDDEYLEVDDESMPIVSSVC